MARGKRLWQPCRVCGKDHTNPSSSSICPTCGMMEAVVNKARNADDYTDDADRFCDPVDVAFKELQDRIGYGGADAVKTLIEAMLEARRG